MICYSDMHIPFVHHLFVTLGIYLFVIYLALYNLNHVSHNVCYHA